MYSKLNKSQKKFNLKTNLTDFKIMNNYIPNFFQFLWEVPELTADIIKNCDINDIKDTLAYLFVNNFYQNILSNNYIENNLLYLLTLLIKSEIENIKEIDEPEIFMGDDSIVGYFMDELRKKNNIKFFFKNSILDIISDLESMSSLNFTLDISKIINNFKQKNEPEKNNKKKDEKHKQDSLKGNSDELRNETIIIPDNIKSGVFIFSSKNSNKKDEQKKFEKFAEIYLRPMFLSDLKKIISESSTSNTNNNAFLITIIGDSKNENSYSNSKLMEQININNNISEKLKTIYLSNFYLIIDLLNKFFSSLEKDLLLLPYPIKCFCKIISVLISKKFPEINIIQKNRFISQFFFKKLIKPILDNPGMELLINNFIISGYTLSNLNIINEVLYKLFSGELFLDNNNINSNIYTPFNWYFIEKIPYIYKLFDKINDMELPSFIDDLINDKLEPNFSFDYFKVNKDEIILHNSICFNCRDLQSLLTGLSKLKDKVDITQYKNGNYILKTFEKLTTGKNSIVLDYPEKRNSSLPIIKECRTFNPKIMKKRFSFCIKENKKKENEKENDIKKDIDINNDNYYLIQELKIHNENNEIFDFNFDSNIYINNIKTKGESVGDDKNIIIKIKNFLNDLLCGIEPLKKSDFNQSNISNTYEILNSIKSYYRLYNNSEEDTIPPEWYIQSFLNMIKTIPEEYTKNDFEKLYDEIEEEINSRLNNYNLYILYECLNRLKYIEKEKKYYDNYSHILKDLELNEKVKYIVENDFIPIKISFTYEDKNKIFDIKKSKRKQEDFKKNKSIDDKKSTNINHCYSIQSFIECFPDFSIFQEKQDIDILELQKNLSVPEKLKEYFFTIIREHLTSQKIIEDQNDLYQIEIKIYDYVMSKIHSKIFPKTDDEDDKLFHNIFMLSWTEPKHFLKEKSNYIFEIFLPETIKNLHSIENEKSPRKKIEFINSIFKSISKVVKFNGGDMALGVDDQMPILSYCFVKAQLNRIFSNLKFIQIYRNSLIEKGDEIFLIQLIAVCSFFKNISYKNYNDISEEEFNKNCNQVMNAG